MEEKTSKFKVGDTVQLKSGGPCMTVVNISAGVAVYIRCMWFDDYSKASAQDFPEEALTESEPLDL